MSPARKAWYEANKEKARACSREWYRQNKDKPDRRARELEKAISRRKKKTGFYPELFNATLEAQAWSCAICEKDLRGIKQCADHNHETGEQRGVLCSRCNMAIGLLEDRYDLLRAAAEYLDAPPLEGISKLL